jgi:hypothetical protein
LRDKGIQNEPLVSHNSSKFKIGDRIQKEFSWGKKYETELSEGTIREVISVGNSYRYLVDYDSDSNFDEEEISEGELIEIKKKKL